MTHAGSHRCWRRRQLRAQVEAIGLAAGDAVMVHAGLRAVGPILGGPDTLIGAILEVLGPAGTLLAYTDWNGDFHDLLDDEGRVPHEIRDDIAPFDPTASRAIRDNGTFAEFVRTFSGAVRSENPGASCAAVGGSAQWFVSDHALDYGYGERSPLAKLVEARGKVLMIGAPLDTLTLLHHAEHLANIPDKRVIRYETPLLWNGQKVWRMFEEFDTGHPVVAGLADDYFREIVASFLQQGHGKHGTIGAAPSILLPAPEIVRFAVEWLEARFR
jgi:aminoglycoside 3-N-acetyltransferase